MHDKDYETRTGEWPALFRYAQNLGFQLSAGAVDQVLVVPFFNNASYFSGGVFAQRWKEILTVIVNGARVVATVPDPKFYSKVDLGVFEKALSGGTPLSVAVQNVVFSDFSFGVVLMNTLRSRMAGVGAVLREIWDFDGNGPPPQGGKGVRVITYDQAVSNWDVRAPSSFHVPASRWSGFPGPR
jgi:hypothetical protein